MAGPLILFDIGGDFSQRAEQERAGSDRWIGERDVRGGEPRRPLEERPAQGLIDEVDHRFDDFRGRLIGAGELAQAVVVDLEEMLIEIEPGLRLVLAERRPVHFVEDAGQRAERGFQRLLIGFVLGEKVERRADQRVRSSQPDRREFDPVLERNVEGLRHQEAESHRLRIGPSANCASLAFWEEQLAPVFLQMLQAAVASRHLLQHFVAQQAAEAGAGLRKRLGAGRRLRRLGQEIRQERAQSLGRFQLRAGGLDVAFEQDDLVLRVRRCARG